MQISADIYAPLSANICALPSAAVCGKSSSAGETGFVLAPGAGIVKNAAEVSGTGPYLNVTNLSATAEGLFIAQLAE